MQQLQLRFRQPPTNGTDTSAAAARSVAADTHTQRARILAFVRNCGARGATDQEIEQALRIANNTVRPRRGELQQARHIVLTDQRRPTASGRLSRVYVAIVEAGPASETNQPTTNTPQS